MRERRRHAPLVDIALDLARLDAAGGGDIGQHEALSRRQGMALDLLGCEQRLVEGLGASLEAGWQREGDGGEQGRQVVFGHPACKGNALARHDGPFRVASGRGDAGVHGLGVGEERHVRHLHDDALQEAPPERHEHGVPRLDGHLRWHGVAKGLPVRQSRVDRDLDVGRRRGHLKSKNTVGWECPCSKSARQPSCCSSMLRGSSCCRLRDDKPEIRHPNCWGVVGGAVESGETFEEALIREVAEEIEEPAVDFEQWKQRETAAASVSMFAARLDKPAASLKLNEGQRVEFVSPQAAMMLPLVPWLAEELPTFVRADLYRRLCPDVLPPGNAEAASVIFVNRDGELLLRLRDDRQDIPFPARWDLIGGAMEAGESPEDAAVRETLEELGLVLEEFLYWGDIRGIVLLHVFMAPLDVAAASLNLTEGERVEWFDPESALALPLVPYMECLIPQFISTPPYRDLYDTRRT